MSGAPRLYLDADAQERVSALLVLRDPIWERLPEASAAAFDEVLYSVRSAVDLLALREDADCERHMAGMLERAGKHADLCAAALDRKTAEAMRKALEALLAPARAHLARIAAEARTPAGRNAIVDLLPREYLILCADCPGTAERVWMHPEAVLLTRRTGAVGAPHLPAARGPELIALLEREGAAAFCERVQREAKQNMIGYCPECRALYCTRHYDTRETWSGSWLEALHGTCMKGHRRELA